jgi:hypothetical protein
MGWLFAVALGLHHKSRAKVLWSLAPIALGHALSIATVVVAALILRQWLDVSLLQWLAAISLLAFGAYRLFARHRSRRTGMQTDFRDLLLWSFIAATGHGAGLMLVPVLMHMPDFSAHAEHMNQTMPGAWTAFIATIVHSVATLVATGAAAMLVYDWFGLAFLRRGWINLDWIWAFALITAGALLIVLRIL